MPYRMRCTVNLDYIAPGAGPMETGVAPMLPGGGANGQTLAVVSKTGGYVLAGTGTGTDPNKALATGDITTLLTALTTDISAQLNAAIAIPQGWPGGNP